MYVLKGSDRTSEAINTEFRANFLQNLKKYVSLKLTQSFKRCILVEILSEIYKRIKNTIFWLQMT